MNCIWSTFPFMRNLMEFLANLKFTLTARNFSKNSFQRKWRFFRIIDVFLFCQVLPTCVSSDAILVMIFDFLLDKYIIYIYSTHVMVCSMVDIYSKWEADWIHGTQANGEWIDYYMMEWLGVAIGYVIIFPWGYINFRKELVSNPLNFVLVHSMRVFT